MIDDAELVRCHKYCADNRAALAVSEGACCFYCRREFSSAPVREYVDGRQADSGELDGGVTALCPLWGNDGVLLLADVRASAELLASMNRHWFVEFE
jgi:hypothetical protein